MVADLDLPLPSNPHWGLHKRRPYRPELDNQPDESVTVSVTGDVTSFSYADQNSPVDPDGNVTLPKTALRHFESFGTTFGDPNPVSAKARKK